MKGARKEQGFGFIKTPSGKKTDGNIVLPEKTPEGFLDQLLKAKEKILSQQPSAKREVDLDQIDHAIDAVKEVGELADLAQTLLHILRLPDDKDNSSSPKPGIGGFDLGRRGK